MKVAPIVCAIALAAGAAAPHAGRAAAAPSVDAAFQRFWDARSPGDAGKAARDVVQSGVTFDEAYARLKRGRNYTAQPKRDVVHLLRRTALGDFSFDLYLPESYDPSRAYQLRFQLHGGVMMREQPTSDSTATQGGRGGRRTTSPLPGDEQIYVMPSAWREAP